MALHNWIHLDLKGIVPDAPRLKAWIDMLADCGFTAILWEYEDRLPWQSWPGTFRAGFSRETWQTIWAHAESHGLTNVPLIQTHGHLEWLLQHEAYADWRENGHINELCPQHPDVQPRLKAWIDEVIALHPYSPYICLGGDETWHLATCDRCKQKVERDSAGRVGVYMEHIGALCRHVAEKQVRPMIWADMLIENHCAATEGRLPAETILIDWQYRTGGVVSRSPLVESSGHEIWGASAIRASLSTYAGIGSLCDRMANVLDWHKELAQKRVAGLIHTTWGRSSSDRPLSGPWEGSYPVFQVAGDPARRESLPLMDTCQIVDRAMQSQSSALCEPAIEALHSLLTGQTLTLWQQQAVRWWIISLRYKQLINGMLINALGLLSTMLTQTSVDSGPWRDELRTNCGVLYEWIDALREQVTAFWADNQLSDREEYLSSRLGGVKAIIDQAVAAYEQGSD